MDTPMRGWEVKLFESPGSAPVFHIVPVEDWVGHEELSTCVCGPLMEDLDDEPDGGVCFWHPSLDGREPLTDYEDL